MKKYLTSLPLLFSVVLFSCHKKDNGSSNGGNPFVPNNQHISVTTQHNDNSRTGWNSSEKLLTVSNVNAQTFGKLFSLAVDDQVYAQPLIVGGIKMDTTIHNVAYIATVNNTLYAYDANNGSLFWHKNFTPTGMRPPRNTDMGDCGGTYEDFSGNIGIVGTPVIDTVQRLIYFVVRATSGNTYAQYLHAVNIINGGEMPGSPVQITATYTGNGDGSSNGVISFNPKTQNQRQALTLFNGRVYITWSSHCDIGPYHGWIIGYNASTLKQEIVYNDTPEGGLGGLWESGMGPSVDNSGNLYVAIGNGTVGINNDPTNVTNIASGAAKLTPSGNSLTVTSYFIPYNYATLNTDDLDVGSIGSLLIPNTNYFFTGCKDGSLYLLDKDNMGGYTSSSNNIQQFFSLNNANANEHCQMAYYKGVASEYVYIWSENDQLKAFPFNSGSGTFDVGNVVSSSVSGPSGETGAMLSVSSNGSTSSSGILWATFPVNCNANQNVCPGVVYAFDASDITRTLWHSDVSKELWNFAKFSSPTVANGHLYVPTFSGFVNVYGITK